MAIPPIVVHFATSGVPEVSRAFAGVGAQIRKFEEQASRDGQRGSRARVAGAQSEAKQKEQAHARLQREVAQLEKQQTKAAEAEEKRREGIVRKSSEMTGREAQKAAAAEIREAEKVTRAVEREEERKMRIRIRSSEMAGRAAAAEAAKEIRASEQAARGRGRFGSRVGGIINGSVGGLLGGAMTLAGSVAGLGGGMLLASAARQQFSAERTAALLVNAGTTNGAVAAGDQTLTPQQAHKQALAAASGLAASTGLSKDALLGSALAYAQNAKGGDFGGAIANMGFFAKMSTVSGADINEIAASAGILQSQNAALGKDPAKMQQMLLNTLAGTHEGSVSMVDVAKQIGTLGSTRSSFSQDEGKTQQSLISLGQIARVGGDVGEMGTFVKDLSLEAGIANAKFKKTHGRNLLHFDKYGRMESPEAMIADVYRGTKGNVTEIGDLFGKRGSALFKELSKSFIDADKTGGLNAGISAALGSVSKISGATMTPEQLDKQAALVLETPGEKLKIAMEKITDTIGDRLEPRLEHFANETLPKLMPVFDKVVDRVTAFADWFADNPLKGIGYIVLAKVGADLAGAGIGAAVKAILSSLLSGARIPVPGGGGVPIPPVAGVAAVAAVGTAASAGMLEQGAAIGEGKGNAAARIAALRRGIAAGTVTAADLAKVQKESEATIAATSGAGAVGRGILGATGVDKLAQWTGLVDKGKSVAGGADAATLLQQQVQAVEMVKNLKSLNEALKTATTGISKMPDVQSGAPKTSIPDRAVH